jgi:hypothetical protein
LEDKWKETYISVPNIRDGDGRLILPNEYCSKLEDKSIVSVNVQLKMYVSFL